MGGRGGHNTRGSHLPGVHRTSILVSPSNPEIIIIIIIFFFFFFFFHWHYSPMWALSCRAMSFHFFLSATNSLHRLTPNTRRSLSTSSFHFFLVLPLLLVPSSWVKIFLGILSSSNLSKWPNQFILYPFTLLSILLYFLFYSSLLVLDSSDSSIPRSNPEMGHQNRLTSRDITNKTGTVRRNITLRRVSLIIIAVEKQ